MKKRFTAMLLTALLAVSLTACNNNDTEAESSSAAATTAAQAETATNAVKQSGKSSDSSDSVVTTVSSSSNGALDTTDLFTERDLTQTADLSSAKTEKLSDGKNISITSEGVYVLTGSAKNVTITVDADDKAKVQLVLDGATITNESAPCIYVKNADKVFVTTTKDSTNSLTVSGAFTADGTTNTDAVIFSKDDLVLNGLGTLTISSTQNGVTCKDDLKITGGTLNVTSTADALEANESLAVADGTITLKSSKDGVHVENKDDNTTGWFYISGGTMDITATDDGVHAITVAQMDGGTITANAAEGIEATYVQINDGTLNITASDDGVNAANKSSSYSVKAEFNGGNITINMGQGDTDGIDSNGDLVINGGTFNITAQSPFDYDGTATKTGGTIIVNGEQTDTITNQMMGGGGMGGGPMGGNMQGGNMQGGNMPNGMNR